MKFEYLNRQFGRFTRDEDGGVLPWVVVTFLIMVVATGMPIDLMRHEIVRADLQNTLDRAVLAAASRTQQADREQVFQDYMARASYSELENVTIDKFESEYSIFKSFVSAQAHYDVPTWFMKLVGVPDLNAVAASAALEGIGEVEIVLVLDVSLSMTMGGSTRLADLKTAAHTFVNTVLSDADGADRAEFTTISIVPFSSNVGMQRMMAHAYAPSTSGTDSMCFDFSHQDFGTIGVSTTTAYTRYDATQGWSEKCPDYTSGNIILPYTNDRDRLNDYIDGLSGVYATSQHIGMKWGLAMIDPSFRDVMRSMVSEIQATTYPVNGDYRAADYWGNGSSQLRGLPVDANDNLDIARANSIPRDYGYNGVQKIIVLMSDGHNRDADTLSQTPLFNQRLEYQCDLIHGRAFDADVFEDHYLPDSYGDPGALIEDIEPLVSADNQALTGVTVYTVALYPPQKELVQENLIPQEIRDKADTTYTTQQCGWKYQGGWKYICEDVQQTIPYEWESGLGGTPDYDFEAWDDAAPAPDVTFTQAENDTIRNRIEPFYTEMQTRLGDSPDEGCASEGLALVADSSSDFEAIFSEIAAETTRLRLLN